MGAGASREAGLPIGSELKTIIAKKLDFRFDEFGRHLLSGDPTIYKALLNRSQRDIGHALDACSLIRNGLALSGSIDDFIDAHRDSPFVSMCGKLAIAASILETERGSKLFFQRKRADSTIDFEALEATWYLGFYRLLSQQVGRAELHSLFKNVSVVTFNYDRCIEHFLTHALAAYYRIGHDEAAKLVQTLPIYRPYGSVGTYDINDFGAKRALDVEPVLTNLRTYTERIEEQAGLAKIRDAIDRARVLVFLGFAFHPNNMRVLGEDNLYTADKRIYATRTGISDSDVAVIQDRLTRLCGLAGKEFYFLAEHRKCVDLFEQYRLSLLH